MSWNDLTMKERAAFIKIGVANGLRNIDDIAEVYNSFAEGGHIYDGKTETSQKIEKELKTNWFTRATLGAAMADAPAVMIASGWSMNPDLTFRQERTKESNKLADNLSILADTANIITGLEDLKLLGKGLYKLITHPKQAIKTTKNAYKGIKNGFIKRLDESIIDDTTRAILLDENGNLRATKLGGAESPHVYIDNTNNRVLKVSGPISSEDLGVKQVNHLLDKQNIGELGVDTVYKGVIETPKGTHVVIEQPLVKSWEKYGDFSYPFIYRNLKKAGWKKKGLGIFKTANGRVVRDIKPENVGTSNGKFVIFDPEILKANGGILNGILQRPFNYFDIPIIKYATGGFKADSATVDSPKYNKKAVNPMYDYLRYRGVPHVQSSALLGNFAVESYLNADLQQIGGPAYGLIQAEKDRQTAMRNYNEVPYSFGSNLTPEEQQQLDYIIDKGIQNYTPGEWGRKGFSSARDARIAFNKETNIQKASDLITKNYLRPSKPAINRRRTMSKYYDSEMVNRLPYILEAWNNKIFEK